MLQKLFAITKRLITGYGFLLSLTVIGLTLGWPFVLTSVLGLGLLLPNTSPFPRDIFQTISILSVVITLAVGLGWLYSPFRRLDTYLEKLHSNLLHPKSWLRLRFVGIIVALPLFAFILSPCAIIWLSLEEGLYSLHLTSVIVKQKSQM